MSAWFLLPLLAVLSWYLSRLVRQRAIQKDLLAHPNHRSSHSIPTPTGGGVGFVASYLLACILCLSIGDYGSPWGLLAMSVGGLLVAIAGYIDDHRHIPAQYRLLLHLLAAGGLLLAMARLPTLATPFGEFATELLLVPLYALGIVWLLNLYNFMDGIDGIAGIETVTVSLAAAVLVAHNGYPQWSALLLALAVCTGGFLVLNWPPAKVFMGDVGSGFLGFILAGLALLTASKAAMPIWCWMILLAVFVTDATVTLLRRAWRGQKIYEAHRSHAYQILSRRLRSHQQVTMLVAAINILWLFPLAWLANSAADWGIVCAIVAYVPLIIWVCRVGAGTTND